MKKKKPSLTDVLWDQIGRNYVFHFECRKYVKNLPPEVVQRYMMYSHEFEPMTLNEWGALDLTRDQINFMIKFAIEKNLPDAWLLIPFYLSEEGWENFIAQWKQLPEVIHRQAVESLRRDVDKLEKTRIPPEFSTRGVRLSTEVR